MPWSRNLGVRKAADVAPALATATAHARGVLSDAEKAQLESLRAVVLSGGELTQNDKNTLKHLSTVSTRGPEHSQVEGDLMDKAGKVAEAAVSAMGGEADVWTGGHHRVFEDGSSQTSMSVTVSVFTPAPVAQPKPPQG